MKNKKAVLDELMKNIIWVILFVILLIGVGFLLRKILA